MVYNSRNGIITFFLYMAILQKVIVIIIIASLKAIMDALAHGKLFKGNSFWDESIAWKNKWKDGDRSKGEKYIGSSTVFVFATSGWHLVQEVLILLIFLVLFGFTLTCLLYWILFKTTFELIYRWL